VSPRIDGFDGRSKTKLFVPRCISRDLGALDFRSSQKLSSLILVGNIQITCPLTIAMNESREKRILKRIRHDIWAGYFLGFLNRNLLRFSKLKS
jgi:hypothetical protein